MPLFLAQLKLIPIKSLNILIKIILVLLCVGGICRRFRPNRFLLSLIFLFNGPATPEIYTLSLHDALPIFEARLGVGGPVGELERDVVSVRRPGRAAAAREQCDGERARAPHPRRSPAASKRCTWRWSSVKPTRSPGRRSTRPGSRATSACRPTSRWASVSAPSGSTASRSAFPTP